MVKQPMSLIHLPECETPPRDRKMANRKMVKQNNAFDSPACSPEKGMGIAVMIVSLHGYAHVCLSTDRPRLYCSPASPIARSPCSQLIDSPRLRSTLDYPFGIAELASSVFVLFSSRCVCRSCSGWWVVVVRSAILEMRAPRISRITLSCAIQNGSTWCSRHGTVLYSQGGWVGNRKMVKQSMSLVHLFATSREERKWALQQKRRKTSSNLCRNAPVCLPCRQTVSFRLRRLL